MRALVSEIIPVSLGMHERAVELARDYGFSFYDALIVAAARQLHGASNRRHARWARRNEPYDQKSIRQPAGALATRDRGKRPDVPAEHKRARFGALSGSTLMLLDVSPSEEVRDERDNKQNEKDVEDDFRNPGGGDGDAAEPK